MKSANKVEMTVQHHALPRNLTRKQLQTVQHQERATIFMFKDGLVLSKWCLTHYNRNLSVCVHSSGKRDTAYTSINGGQHNAWHTHLIDSPLTHCQCQS